MSMIVLHLRWNDADADQYQRMLELLPEGRGLPDSTPHTRQLRHRGRAILDTEVWGDDDSAKRFLDQLPYVSEAAGLEPPQVVAFCMPALYGAIYARDAARLAAGATPSAVPAQTRSAAVQPARVPTPAGPVD